MNSRTIKKLKVAVLIEDTAPKRPFWGEHGLSFWIEADGKSILFDTGQSGEVLLHNLEVFDFKLEAVKAFILSHPHDDHSGGLRLIVNQIKDVPMYCVSGTFQDYVPDRERISRVMPKVTHPKETLEIFPGIWVPKERETINTPKSTKEINLVINVEGKGLVVVVGCSHHGLSNVISDAKSLFQNRLPIYALLGGLHLKDTSKEEIITIINSFKGSGLKLLAPNHCTGFNALTIMAETFPEEMRLVANSDTGTFHTGAMIEF